MIAEPLSAGAVQDASSHVSPAVSDGADGASGSSAAGPSIVAEAGADKGRLSGVQIAPAVPQLPVVAGSLTVTSSSPEGSILSIHRS